MARIWNAARSLLDDYSSHVLISTPDGEWDLGALFQEARTLREMAFDQSLRIGCFVNGLRDTLVSVAALADLATPLGLLSDDVSESVLRDQLSVLRPSILLFGASQDPGKILRATDGIWERGRWEVPGWECFRRTDESIATSGDLPPGVVISTSGTTGIPKCVYHTEASLIGGFILLRRLRSELLGSDMSNASIVDLDDWLGSRGAGGVPMVTLTTLPPTSIAGVTLVLQSLLGCERIVDCAVDKPRDLIAAIDSFQVTSVGLAPFEAQLLLREWRMQGLKPGALPSLLVLGLGGAEVETGLAGQLEASIGCAVVTSYGSTESAGAISLTRFDDDDAIRDNTIGRVVPGVDAHISAEGELCVRSSALALGYLSRTGDEILSIRDDEGWYHTGDIVELEPTGAFRFLDRLDALIHRGATRIDPRTIEEALESDENVEAAAVCRLPGRIEGVDEIAAMVVAARPVSAAELRKGCVAVLGPLATPRVFYFAPVLPRLPDGVLDRRAVRQSILESREG